MLKKNSFFNVLNVLMLLFTLSSCGSKNNNNEIYVLKPFPLNNKKRTYYPVFHGKYNFIFTDNNSIYFYSKEPQLRMCGTGIDPMKPTFLALKKSDLKSIQPKHLIEFVKKRMYKALKDTSSSFIVTLTAFTDTIRTPYFFELKRHLKHYKQCKINCRKINEEEYFVSIAKLGNSDYNPFKIKWKIGFDDGSFHKTFEYIP